jgi:molecular chaperone GrpE
MISNMEEHKNGHKENHKEPLREELTVTIPETEYLKMKDQMQQLQDKVLRLQADFENTRKRQEKDRQEFIRFANEGIIVELLNILDDLERTVNLAESNTADWPAFLKGVEMILAHLYDMLKEHGIKQIEAQGKIFDPHLHEALMQTENKDLPEHTVVEELQKGYLLNDRVIRTAKVKVSKK